MSNMTIIIDGNAADIDPNLIVFVGTDIFKSIRKFVKYFQIRYYNLLMTVGNN